MAKVHFVKSARKDNPIAKKGESYYWWQLNRFTPKQFSKIPPKQSQLHSGFLGEFYSIIENIEEGKFKDFDTFQDDLESLKDEFQNLLDQCQDSLDNMPDHLRDTSPTGELLNERIETLEGAISDLENIEVPEYDAEEDGDENEWKEDKLRDLREEVDNALPGF